MTQDELWLKKYQEIMSFTEENHRRSWLRLPQSRLGIGETGFTHL